MKFLTPRDLTDFDALPRPLRESIRVTDMVEVAFIVDGRVVREWQEVVGKTCGKLVILMDGQEWRITHDFVHNLK